MFEGPLDLWMRPLLICVPHVSVARVACHLCLLEEVLQCTAAVELCDQVGGPVLWSWRR